LPTQRPAVQRPPGSHPLRLVPVAVRGVLSPSFDLVIEDDDLGEQI
jgi:hypothetical protein